MYTIPPIGTVLPAKENTNPNIPNPGPTTSQTAFYQWAQAAAQEMAFRQNFNAASGFKNWNFPSWLNDTYPFQPNPDLAPPTPPAAYVVIVAPAEAAPVDFQVVQSGTTVVMPFKGWLTDDMKAASAAVGIMLSELGLSTGQYIPVCGIPTYTKIAPPADPSKNKIA